jgi:predicted RNA-binding Zn ribbon-like protein
MVSSYPGPVRDEPLAVELSNTLYAVRGRLHDGLETAEGVRAWLAALADRLPGGARTISAARHGDLRAMRDAVRAALAATLDGQPPPAEALEALNAAAARAPASRHAVLDADGRLRAADRHHGADAVDIALASFATDAIELLTGPEREHLRACRAPGCVLLFLQDHPRRTWCSATCGNRARQARHYERAKRTAP